MKTLEDKQLERQENLLRVMKVVAKKPKIAYKITDWGTKFKSVDEMVEYYGVEPKDAPPCKTVACTAGWAGTDPWFRRRGLKLIFTKGGNSMMIMPGGGGSYSTDLSLFFGTDYWETEALFFKGPDGNTYGVTADDIVKYLSQTILPKYRKLAKQRHKEAKKVGKK